MATDLRFENYNHERDGDAVVRCLLLAFGEGEVGECSQFLTSVGHENVRVVRERGVAVACIGHIPMGQYFGGRSVPSTGISIVAVAPEARGRGIATFLMRESTKQLHAQGKAIATLYPATQQLYRRAGYEQAGHSFQYRVPLAGITVGERASARPFRDEDLDGVKDCHARWAVHHNGSVDRGEELWRRARSRRSVPSEGYVIEGSGGRIDAYVFAVQTLLDRFGDHQELQVIDLCASTPGAAQRLLGFLGDFKSIPDTLIFHGGPSHPLLMLLNEQKLSTRMVDYWMTRIINVPAALEARGYARGLTAELHLEISDDLIADNDGRCVLSVADGRGVVHRGGEGHLRTSVRTFAPLYTGFFSAGALAQAGLIEGTDEDFATASAIFAGSTPSMSDRF